MRTHQDSALAADQDDGRPQYLKVKASLVSRIARNEWRPGDVVPAETELAAQYEVSVGTIRRAIAILVDENVLVRRHGKGTFIATYDWRRTLSHVFRLIGDDGKLEIPSARLIGCETGVAIDIEAQRLQIRRQSKVVRIKRIRLSGQTPFISERIVVPYAIFGDLGARSHTLESRELYAYFGQEFGVMIKQVHENLRAVAASDEDASLLGIKRNTPLLEIDRIAVSLPGSPIEWRISRCQTSHCSYQSSGQSIAPGSAIP